MALTEVKVPDIGDFKDVPVIEILVKVGDTIKPEDSLVTLESDKATMDVPSPAAGVVKEIKVKLGDNVGEGAVLLLEAEAGAAATPAQQSCRKLHPSPATPAACRSGTSCTAKVPLQRHPRQGGCTCTRWQLQRQGGHRNRHAGTRRRPWRLFGRLPRS